MLQKCCVWFARLGALLLVPGILLLCFEWAALNGELYGKLYAEFDAERATGLSGEGLKQTTQVLISYLRGEREDIRLRAEVWGEAREVFNEKEEAHMRDVRALFALERKLRGSFLLIGALLCLLSLLPPARERAARFGRALRGSALGWGAALAALALIAACDFERIFLLFHRLFFANDLWLLNPETDLMIRLLPEQFFAGISLYAAAAMACGLVLSYIAGACLARAGRKGREA